MGSKRITSHYCDITTWIADQDADFASLIKALCLGRFLPSSRYIGTTFLFPSKEERAKLLADAQLPEKAKVEEVIRKISSCILPECYTTATQFERSAPVGNKLGVSFGKATVQGDKVSFNNKQFTLKPVESFKVLDSTKRNNAVTMAVWELESGWPPETSPVPYETPKSAPGKGGRQKTGGAAEDAPSEIAESAQLRARHANATEECYRQKLAASQAAPGAAARDARKEQYDPYLAASVSLLLFLKEHHKNVFSTVAPLLDRDPFITYYLLVEPYRQSGGEAGYLVPTSAMFGGANAWNGLIIYNDAGEQYLKLLNEAAAAAPAVEVTEDQRYAIIEQTSRSAMADDIRKAYAAAFSDGAERRLWMDLFRFVVDLHLGELRMQHSKEARLADFESLLGLLRTTWSSPDGTVSAPLLAASAPDEMAYIVMLIKFVWTADFLYALAPESAAAAAHYTDGRFDLDNVTLGVFNRAREAIQLAKRASMVRPNALPAAYQAILDRAKFINRA